MEENAFPLMSFQGVDRHFSSVGKSDKALEHRRWLKFGLGTNAKRFAPIRQGEGVSRTISGDSKGQRVLWRVFLHTLSSRKERVCPRRAFRFEKRFVSLGVATGFAHQINARNNPPDLANARPAPFTQRGLSAVELRRCSRNLNMHRNGGSGLPYPKGISSGYASVSTGSH